MVVVSAVVMSLCLCLMTSAQCQQTAEDWYNNGDVLLETQANIMSPLRPTIGPSNLINHMRLHGAIKVMRFWIEPVS